MAVEAFNPTTAFKPPTTGNTLPNLSGDVKPVDSASTSSPVPEGIFPTSTPAASPIPAGIVPETSKPVGAYAIPDTSKTPILPTAPVGGPASSIGEQPVDQLATSSPVIPKPESKDLSGGTVAQTPAPDALGGATPIAQTPSGLDPNSQPSPLPMDGENIDEDGEDDEENGSTFMGYEIESNRNEDGSFTPIYKAQTAREKKATNDASLAMFQAGAGATSNSGKRRRRRQSQYPQQMGYPQQQMQGNYFPQAMQGGYPQQMQGGGYPQSQMTGANGYPQPMQNQVGYPQQMQGGGYPQSQMYGQRMTPSGAIIPPFPTEDGYGMTVGNSNWKSLFTVNEHGETTFDHFADAMSKGYLVIIISLVILVWLSLYLFILCAQLFFDKTIEIPAEMATQLSSTVTFLLGGVIAFALDRTPRGSSPDDFEEEPMQGNLGRGRQYSSREAGRDRTNRASGNLGSQSTRPPRL